MARRFRTPGATARARRLRRAQTEAERALWRRLRAHRLGGLGFRRQAPVGPYVADFLCPALDLVVELDGGGHADPAQVERDLARSAFLARRGLRVRRFWNTEVHENMEGVLTAILNEIPRATAVAPGGPADLAVTLPYDDRHRRRARLTTDDGEPFLLDLPETTELRDGDALVLEDGRRIRVVAAAEPLLEVRAEDPRHLTRLAWHLGNRHLPVAIEADRLLIRRDHVIAGMLAQLGALTAEVEAPFSPEGGAYGHGRTHGHVHSHDPHHDPNAHIHD